MIQRRFRGSKMWEVWYNGRSGSVAQLVEQRPEEPCVDGSSPPGTTRNDFSKFDEVFYLRFTEVGDLFFVSESSRIV